MKLNQGLGLALLVCGLAAGSASGQVLFSDDFETNSASRWAAYGGGNSGVTNDFTVQFNYNYGAQNYLYNGQSRTVPAAPNSSGTTKGIKVTANKNRTSGTGRIAAVSVYPVGLNASGNYSLRFDMFMDYIGDTPGGGTGSTEMSTFGINHTGDKVNWFSRGSTFTAASWPGDGVWFWVDGENGTGGTTQDIEAFKGDPSPGAAIPLGAGGGFLYPQDGLWDINNPATYDQAIAQVMPAPPGQTPGAPGKQWVMVEIRQQGGYVTWLMNGFVIASHNDVNGYTSGTVMIGYCDPLAGVPSPNKNENWTIYDNVRVVSLGTEEMTPTVSVVASQPNANKPGSSQSDYGVFTFTRQDSGGNPVSPSTPLTVYFTLSGSAVNGVDYATISTNVTIPAGASTYNLNIRPTSLIGDPTSTVRIKLVRPAGVYGYELRATTTYSDTVTITDPRGVPSVNVQAVKSVACENYRSGRFNLIAAASYPTNVTINLSLTGSATNGLDYATIASSVTIQAGSTNVFVDVTPINNSIIEASNRTVILNLLSGNGYRIGNTSNATVIIRNDDLAFNSVLFSDNFDTDSSANWNVNKTQASDAVTFAYDYSADGIPPAPGGTNGTTKGVKMEANLSAAAAAGISLSPKNGNFTGDYRLRFDVWINYPGPLAGGSSDSYEFFSAGVGTKGTITVWGAATNSDGIWFDCDGDGSSTVAADFEAFRGTTSLMIGGENVWAGGSQSGASPYYAEFGGLTAPQAQIDAGVGSDASYVGSMGFAWHDMAITKQGTNVTWTVDGLPFAIVPTTGATMSTNVFVGYYDPTSGVNAAPQFAFAIVDNLRVESLAAPVAPAVSRIQKVGSNIQINFTAGASDVPTAFTLVGSSVLATNGSAYTPVSGASITGSGGTFQATAPVSGNTMFYRIKR